jgi:hypothetical protein
MGNVKLMKKAGLFPGFLAIINKFLVDPEDSKTRVALLKLIDSEDPESPNILLNYTGMVKARLVKPGLIVEMKNFLSGHWDIIQAGKEPLLEKIAEVNSGEYAPKLQVDAIVEEGVQKLKDVGSGVPDPNIMNPDAEVYFFMLGKTPNMKSKTGKLLPSPGPTVYLRGNPWRKGSVSSTLHSYLKEFRTLKELKDFASGAAENISDATLKKFLFTYASGEKLFEGCYLEIKNGHFRVIELGSDDLDIQYLVANQDKKEATE